MLCFFYDVYEDFLRRGSAELPEKYTAVMRKAAEEYSATILSKLREYEFNPEIMRLTVMGGGACILKHFSNVLKFSPILYVAKSAIKSDSF